MNEILIICGAFCVSIDTALIPLICIVHDRDKIRPAGTLGPLFQESQPLLGPGIHSYAVSAEHDMFIALFDRTPRVLEAHEVLPPFFLIIAVCLVEPQLHPPVVKHMLAIAHTQMPHKGMDQAIPLLLRKLFSGALLHIHRVSGLIMDRVWFQSQLDVWLHPLLLDKIQDRIDLAEVIKFLFRADIEFGGEDAPETHIFKAQRSLQDHQMLPHRGMQQVRSGTKIDRISPERFAEHRLIGKVNALGDLRGSLKLVRFIHKFLAAYVLLYSLFDRLCHLSARIFPVHGIRTFAEFRRCHAVCFFEYFVEQGGRSKAAVIGDPGHRDIRIKKLVSSMEESYIGEIVGEACSVILFEKTRKITVGEVELFGEFLHTDRLIVVGVDIVVDLLQALFVSVAFVTGLNVRRLNHKVGSEQIHDLVTVCQETEGAFIVVGFYIVFEQALHGPSHLIVSFALRACGIAPENNFLTAKRIAHHHVVDQETQNQGVIYRLYRVALVRIDHQNIFCAQEHFFLIYFSVYTAFKNIEDFDF